ncbi:hypothetical protein ABW20_dc0106072 [Dactylellina cionopaga]|nr:hypothetical protein ABW20_dc0106072 [Dactylellina cionopaga]
MASASLQANAAAESEITTTLHPEIEADSASDPSYSDIDSDLFREGQYFLPNDEAEQDRLDMHHHMLTIIQHGQLHGAPISPAPQQILDCGTGTGIWAIDIADLYPSAVVIGNDLSPIQPNWVPPNLKFEVDDLESEWTYPPGTFDFIYCRYLLGGIADWPKLIKQAFKALKPGGYLEILDPDSEMLCDDGSIPPDAPLRKWSSLFVEAGAKAGRSLVDAPKYKNYMQDVGFTEINEEIFRLPATPWPKDKHLKQVGAYHLASFLEALEGLSLRFFSALHGMDPEEIQVMLVDVRKDLKNKSYHAHYHL